MEDQGNPSGLLVENPFGGQLVRPILVAMVRGKNQQGVIGERRGGQRIEHHSDIRIHHFHIAIIGPAIIAPCIIAPGIHAPLPHRIVAHGLDMFAFPFFGKKIIGQRRELLPQPETGEEAMRLANRLYIHPPERNRFVRLDDFKNTVLFFRLPLRSLT